MKLGLHVVNFTWPGGARAIGATLGGIAEAAEESGFAKLSVMDHYFQMEMIGDPTTLDMLEGYTALGFIAAKTKSLRLGLLVGGVTYRQPGVLAKIVTTLDVLSGGRAELGIGAAWYEREHKGLGVPFPPLKERFERLEETIKICLQMWSDDNGPFVGKHYQLAETLSLPQTLQRPHPPIMIGGGGEKKTLKLVARYADACNLFSREGPAFVAHKLDVLKRHCDDEKRDYDKIEKTMIYAAPRLPLGAAADAFVKDLDQYAKLAIRTVILVPFGDRPIEDVRAFEPTAKRVAAIGVG
ncbi:MAG: LLM class F420-dependent oxidoreductase [Alphaproteobacteria bacterium]|nr:LLM class F420-dependent oxidoreductase [Alphaproteobacteria bacterium]